MSTTIDITVDDTGVTIAGSFTQQQLGLLESMTGCSAKFSLLKTGEGGTGTIVNEAAATIGAFDQATATVAVSYRLQPADVSAACALAKVRWTLVLADGSKIHAPGPRGEQTYVRINA
jgi:hypothetical protein